MARPIRCDHCGKEEQLEGTYHLPPAGWLTVQQATSATRPYWSDYNPRDVCSLACALAFLQQLEAYLKGVADAVAEDTVKPGESIASA